RRCRRCGYGAILLLLLVVPFHGGSRLVGSLDRLDQADVEDFPAIALDHDGGPFTSVRDRLGVGDCDRSSARRLEPVGAKRPCTHQIEELLLSHVAPAFRCRSRNSSTASRARADMYVSRLAASILSSRCRSGGSSNRTARSLGMTSVVSGLAPTKSGLPMNSIRSGPGRNCSVFGNR